jgi:type IV secretion system protein VirB5
MRDPLTNPAKRAEEASVGVEILSVLRQTEETWEIDWVETNWNRQGVQEGRNRMRGILTMYIVPPTSAPTEDEIRMNPLGLYVRDFPWARIAD